MPTMESRDAHFINGKWLLPADGGSIEVIDPATEEPFGRAPDAGKTDIDNAVAAARRAFDEGPWPSLPASERAAILRRMGAYLGERSSQIADLIVREMGAPISFLAHSAQAATMMLDYYAGLGVEAEPAETRKGLMAPYLVRREPVGVVAAIVPWNGPLFLLLAKCAPALAAGCTVVAKPAPETPLDAFVLADAALAAGLPPGVPVDACRG